MTVASCTEFLRRAHETPGLLQCVKAITATPEFVVLGRVHGYEFEASEVAEASMSLSHLGSPTPAPTTTTASRPRAYHYEYDLADIPALAAVAREMPNLTIKPATVDLAEFDASFRAEDMRLLDESPDNAPGIKQVYQGAPSGPAPVGVLRRDFHLVNLDEHAEHPGYHDYFAAKTRVIGALEQAFGTEIRFSGSMWYPPGAYRMWHTNKSQPGWRMYVVVPSEESAQPHELSYFRYRNPRSGELVTLVEPKPVVRFFRAEHEPDRLFWHCIGNPGRRHRWSFGFVVPDDWMTRLADVTPDNGSQER